MPARRRTSEAIANGCGEYGRIGDAGAYYAQFIKRAASILVVTRPAQTRRRDYEEEIMHSPTKHLSHARALLADIAGSPTIYLPRRDILVEWLQAFVGRAQATSYDLPDTEAKDLAALDEFLRANNVPVQ
jgi:hypothetical protein